jgi:hypothetical protein
LIATTIPAPIALPASIPIARQPLVTGDLVEVVVLLKKVET